MKEVLRAYYRLTKPGIVQGNALHTLAGALLASRLPLDWVSVIGVVIGTSLVIASACVANNYMDRSIDAKMKRTKRRPSVTGAISLRRAMLYAAVLLLAGFAVLIATTNLTVVIIGVLAYVLYVFVYGWAKRTTEHSTLIGAIPGALPAAAGYVAVSGDISLAAFLVFLVIFLWQMPHFYAIAIFRRDEYRSAGLPVLGVTRSFRTVYWHILGYMVLYVASLCGLIATMTVGPATGLLLLTGAAYWWYVVAKVSDSDSVRWARSVFGASLVVSIVFLVAAVVNIFIPPAM